MKFGEFVSADICQAAVEQSPAHKATLYHRKRKVAEKRLHECSGLSWGTSETLSCVYASDHTVMCMGGFLIFLFFHCLLHKWRRHKGAYPTASRYASRVSTRYNKVVGKVHKIWRRQKHAFDRKVFHLKVWCLVLYYLILGKLYRARTRFKKKVIPLVHHVKLAYMKVTSITYRHLPPLRVSAMVIFLGLFVSGDIELNPGPKEGRLEIKDLKTVRDAVWEARTEWMDIGIELNIIKTDLDAIKETEAGNLKKCLTEMLSLWLKQVDPPPTWLALVTALKRPTIGLQQVAEEIEKMYIVEDSNSLSTEVARLSFPHIKEMVSDEHAREELEYRLRMESKDIMLEFRILQHKFFDSVEERNITVDKLVEYLEQEVSAALQRREIDSKPKTLEEMKEFIKCHSSFYDYQLIKYMIKLIGTDEDKDQLKQYEQEFSTYAKRRVCECPSTFCSLNDTDSELRVKLDSTYYDDLKLTLEELKHLQYRLCSLLGISFCRLTSIEKGCFLLTFLIPCHVQEAVFPLSDEQEKALIELGVHQLTCGTYQFPRIDDQNDRFEADIHNDKGLPPSRAAMRVAEMEQNIANQPSSITTFSMSITDYLITAHISAQQYYYQQLHNQESLGSATTEDASFKNIYRQESMQNEIDTNNDVDEMEGWNEAKRKCPDSGYESASVSSIVTASEYVSAQEILVDRVMNVGERSFEALRTVLPYLMVLYPVFVAGLRGDLNKFKQITEHMNINWQTDKFFGGYSALHLAAVDGNLDTLRFLIENEECNPSPKTSLGRTPLHLAAQHRRLEVVRYLVCDCSVDPSEEDDNKLKALHHACIGGNLEIIMLLIEEGSKYIPTISVISEKTASGDTALHFAAGKGHISVLQILLCLQVDPNLKGKNEYTALHYASHNDHIHVAKYLIEEWHCNPLCQDVNGNTPLHLASLYGHIHMVKLLTLEGYCDPTCRNSDNLTPLHVAALNGHYDVVRFLISEVNCDPNTLGWENNRTPLHAAAQQGHLHIVKYLIDNQNCNPSCQDINKTTPLHLASMNGHLNTIKYLTVDKNCDPTIRDSKCNFTPLHFAAFNGHYNVVKYLVSELNCNPNIQGGEMDTMPLHLAALEGHLHIIIYLIEEEHCDLLCRDMYKSTPLHLASTYGHMDTVKYLTIDKNCDPEVKNLHDLTPLHGAAISGHHEVIRFLVSELNCNPNTLDMLMNTPLHFATLFGRKSVVKYLVEECNCSPHWMNCGGVTPLMFSLYSGFMEVYEYLVTKKHQHNIKAVPNYEFKQLPAFLLHIAFLGSLQTLKYLVEEKECNPSVSATYVDGREYTPLHTAALMGHLDIIKYLTLEKLCDPLCRDSFNNTPLHIAALSGHLEIVKFLTAELTCDPSTPGFKDTNFTPLHLAAENGHLHVVKYLVEEKHCDSSCQAVDKSTPIHRASLNGHLSIIKYLTEERQCNPACQTVNKVTPLFLASMNGHLDTVKYLTVDRKCDPAVRNDINITPLHAAALINGHFDVVRFFISELNCDPNTRGWKQNRTPLHVAAEKGHLHIVKYLVDEKHCNPSCQDTNKVTPLYLASMNGHLETVKYLTLEKHCDPTCKDSNNDTCLHSAAAGGHLQVLDFFISELNCDHNISNSEGEQPIHFAAQSGDLPLVRYLIEKLGCSLQTFDNFNRTPFISASRGSVNVIDYLVTEYRAECDPMFQIITGDSAIHFAAFNAKLEIVDYLIDKCKCDPNTPGWKNRTPLHYAAEGGHLHLFKHLINKYNCQPTAADKEGSTPLHFAGVQGHLLIVKHLTLDLNCDPLQVDDYGNTALHDAARNGHLEVVRFLVETLHCPVNMRGSCHMTPLEWAFFKGHFHVVKYLNQVEDRELMILGD